VFQHGSAEAAACRVKEQAGLRQPRSGARPFMGTHWRDQLCYRVRESCY